MLDLRREEEVTPGFKEEEFGFFFSLFLPA